MNVEAPSKRTEWRVERVAWGVMLTGLALGLVGFFGGGPISSATTEGETGGLSSSLEYQRFGRAHAVQVLTLRISPPTGVDEVRLGLAEEWLREVDIESMTPQGEPQVGAGRTWFSVPVGEDGTGFVITIQYRPRSWGSLGSDIAVEAAEATLILQFDQALAP